MKDTVQEQGFNKTGREQPDLVSSSPEYARRFKGKWGRYLLSGQNRLVADCLPAGRKLRILDIGGGHGQLMDTYADRDILPTVFGSGPQSFQLLDRTQVPCVVGDYLRLPFPDKSFDIVVALRQISHLNEWRHALAEMSRVALIGVIIDYPPLESLNLLTPLLFKIKLYFEGDTRSYNLFRSREMKEELESHGFKVARNKREFLLPIVVHRFFRSSPLLRALEKLFRATGLTDLFGNPAILYAVRSPADQSATNAAESETQPQNVG